MVSTRRTRAPKEETKVKAVDTAIEKTTGLSPRKTRSGRSRIAESSIDTAPQRASKDVQKGATTKRRGRPTKQVTQQEAVEIHEEETMTKTPVMPTGFRMPLSEIPISDLKSFAESISPQKAGSIMCTPSKSPQKRQGSPPKIPVYESPKVDHADEHLTSTAEPQDTPPKAEFVARPEESSMTIDARVLLNKEIFEADEAINSQMESEDSHRPQPGRDTSEAMHENTMALTEMESIQAQHEMGSNYSPSAVVVANPELREVAVKESTTPVLVPNSPEVLIDCFALQQTISTSMTRTVSPAKPAHSRSLLLETPKTKLSDLTLESNLRTTDLFRTLKTEMAADSHPFTTPISTELRNQSPVKTPERFNLHFTPSTQQGLDIGADRVLDALSPDPSLAPPITSRASSPLSPKTPTTMWIDGVEVPLPPDNWSPSTLGEHEAVQSSPSFRGSVLKMSPISDEMIIDTKQDRLEELKREQIEIGASIAVSEEEKSAQSDISILFTRIHDPETLAASVSGCEEIIGKEVVDYNNVSCAQTSVEIKDVPILEDDSLVEAFGLDLEVPSTISATVVQRNALPAVSASVVDAAQSGDTERTFRTLDNQAPGKEHLGLSESNLVVTVDEESDNHSVKQMLFDDGTACDEERTFTLPEIEETKKPCTQAESTINRQSPIHLPASPLENSSGQMSEGLSFVAIDNNQAYAGLADLLPSMPAGLENSLAIIEEQEAQDLIQNSGIPEEEEPTLDHLLKSPNRLSSPPSSCKALLSPASHIVDFAPAPITGSFSGSPLSSDLSCSSTTSRQRKSSGRRQSRRQSYMTATRNAVRERALEFSHRQAAQEEADLQFAAELEAPDVLLQEMPGSVERKRSKRRSNSATSKPPVLETVTLCQVMRSPSPSEELNFSPIQLAPAESDAREHIASAIKIQAIFRGWRTRRQLTHEAVDNVQNGAMSPQNEAAIEIHDEDGGLNDELRIITVAKDADSRPSSKGSDIHDVFNDFLNKWQSKKSRKAKTEESTSILDKSTSTSTPKRSTAGILSPVKSEKKPLVLIAPVPSSAQKSKQTSDRSIKSRLPAPRMVLNSNQGMPEVSNIPTSANSTERLTTNSGKHNASEKKRKGISSNSTEESKKRPRLAKHSSLPGPAAMSTNVIRPVPTRSRTAVPIVSSLKPLAPTTPKRLNYLTPAEVMKATKTHTHQNMIYRCDFDRVVVRKDVPRPPSPTAKIQTKMALNARTKRKRLMEKKGYTLGAGDDDDYCPKHITPTRKAVKWGEDLEVNLFALDKTSPTKVKPIESVAPCLVTATTLDDYGNVENQMPLTPELGRAPTVVITKYLYRGEQDD